MMQTGSPDASDPVAQTGSSSATLPRSTPAGGVRRVLFACRLGGIAGLLAVVLAWTLGIGQAARNPTIAGLLPMVTNLVAVLWFLGVAAIQWRRLGRLGFMGLGAACAGLTAIALLQLVPVAAAAEPGNWASSLLASPALPPVFAATAVFFVWGLLALGTTSLQAGVMPHGAVVLWTVGLIAAIVTSWFAVSALASAGIVWSSIILLRAKNVTHATDPRAVIGGTGAALARFIPLDALRGTVMALMAIDHASIYVRRWHPFETWDQPLPDYPSVAAMLTRLATHPCAPGFFFLMGAGMLLFAQSRRKLGWSVRRIAGHLALRGLLFIALEQLIVDLATSGQVNPLDFSILAGLGAAMLFGILFLRMSGPVQAAVGTGILLIMQFLPGLLLRADLGVLSPIRLLLLPGSVGPAYVLYPPIPWLGVAILGMAFARLLLRDPDRAYRGAGIVGLACLASFPIVRALGGFGNLRMPSGHTFVDFFNVVKYPPSLSFLLLSLGFDLVLLYLFSRTSSWLATRARPLVILGQAALYFFLVHWFIYGAMGQAWPTPGGLPQTYLVWGIGLILLYPLCKAFEAFKHGMPATSVWRMV